MQPLRRQVRCGGSGQPLHVRRTAAGPVRSRGHPAPLATARSGQRSGEHVALRGGAALAVANLCMCGGPLLVRYDLAVIRHRWPRREVANGPANMWRYAPVLPAAEASVVTLGEGWTPLVRTRRLGARIGAEQLWVKDEGLNPTASFKARGLSCAVSMCVELGIKKVAIPSAGNAASAMAAYAAAAGIEAHIFMPRDVPQSNYLECKAYGAHVTLVDGLISDCGRMVAEQGPKEGWFD